MVGIAKIFIFIILIDFLSRFLLHEIVKKNVTTTGAETGGIKPSK